MKKFYLLFVPFLLTWSCMKENVEAPREQSENLANLELSDDEVKSLLMLGNPAPLTEEAAVKAAKQFFSQNVNTATKADELAVTNVYVIENDVVTKGSETAYDGPIAYAVNFGNKEGFVVMTADPLESDVAMYSDNGYFDGNDEFMQYMMENLKYASISKAQQNAKLTGEYAEKTLEKISRHSGVNADILKSTFTGNVVYGTAPEKTDAITKGGMPEYYFEVVYTDWWNHETIGPLLTTKMHRKAPYNANLQVYGIQLDARADAIAVGQILAYYEKPQNYMFLDTLRVFNWSQIKSNYWTQSVSYNREVQIFMNSVHTMLNIFPKPTSNKTYATLNEVKKVFWDYLFPGRPPVIIQYDLAKDPEAIGKNKVTSDIFAERPVYARGTSPGSSSKDLSWVIDGYKQDRRIRYNNAFYYDYDGNKIYEPSMNTHSLQIGEYWHYNLGIDTTCLDIYCNMGSFLFTCPEGYNFSSKKIVLTNIVMH